MDILRRYQSVLINGACVLIFAGLGWYAGVWWLTGSARYQEAETIGQVKTFDELKERFGALADKKGARYAFEVLRRAPVPPNTDMHLLGHVVGDKLFEQEGVEGIAACTQEFRNACSHSIVTGALREEGEGALSKIREACKDAPGGPGAYTMCFHGLGHGVFSFYDYEYEPTVSFCEKTGTDEYRNREAIECIGGSVMELMGGGGHDPEGLAFAQNTYLNPQDPLAPCFADFMPSYAQGICLTYLTPQLWRIAGIELGSPDPNLFGKAFAYCNQIPTSKQHLRDACYGGFGKEFIPLTAARDIRAVDQLSEENMRTVILWCGKAQVSDGIAACIGDALSSLFWGGENDPEASFRFCSLQEEQTPGYNACYERLGGAIRAYVLDTEVRSAQCNRIPEKFRTLCSL